jgi:hypothetical protein
MAKQKKAPSHKAKSKKAAQGSSVRHGNSKQAQVIAMMRRPQGATLEEMQKATDWLSHTVRGAIAGAIKKKLGLAVTSTREERGRVYRIADRS